MKARSEPGEFIPYEEVSKKLTARAYGAVDLVSLGLFYSEHFVRDAMNTGKLKFQKINKRVVVISRDDVLEYWKQYRKEPHEMVNNSLQVMFKISDVDYISSLIRKGQNFNKNFCKNDLFRNIMNYLQKMRINEFNTPEMFNKSL